MSQSSLVHTPKPSLTYRLVSSLLVFPVFRLLFRGSTSGNNRVPMQGPLVVVANHGSHLDPPLLGHALGRPVAFMAKAELFSIPLLGHLIRACGAYPVRRGASDREAIRTATARLRRRLGNRGVSGRHPTERRPDQQPTARSGPALGSHGSPAAAGGHLQQPPRLGQRAQLAAPGADQLRIGDPMPSPGQSPQA